jgi:hypothetical protein
MGQINWDLPDEEQDIILDIAARAKKMDAEIDAISLSMDLAATHKYICKLRLDDLLHSDDFNFIHDVFGILHSLNREHLVLRGNFLPRYCAGIKKNDNRNRQRPKSRA